MNGHGHGHGQPPPGGWGPGVPPGGSPPHGGHPGQPQSGHPGQPHGGQYPAPASGVKITADFIFLQWMLYFTNPIVTVMGQQHEIKWGRPHVFALPPGNHQLKIHYPWIFQDGNPATTWVPVYLGYVTEISYSTSFIVFTSGNITPRGHKPWGT